MWTSCTLVFRLFYPTDTKSDVMAESVQERGCILARSSHNGRMARRIGSAARLIGLCASTFWPALASAQFTATRLQADTTISSARVFAVHNGALGGHAPNPNTQPVVWSSPTAPFISLAPVTPGGIVYAMNSTQQFGTWGGDAAMWSGGPSSYVNLSPAGAENSEVLAASSTQQAGWTVLSGQEARATLWSGTAASALSLQPFGARTSRTYAMTETHQGGAVVFPGLSGHAALWSGTAASFVDLHPVGQSSSGILGMSGDQQVGVAQAIAPGSSSRAAMWFGTPESFRTMHPFPTGLSAINATCGSAQVGYMNSVSFGPGAGIRAAIWFGTAESVFDLSQFLPAGYGQSIATCVEERDGIFTVGGYVQYGFTDQAFVWVGVPAPGTALVVIAPGILAFRRRR
jgi:hypothetical protein